MASSSPTSTSSISISSSLISSSPTSAAPQALTTPFVPPSTLNCADQFSTTSFFKNLYDGDIIYVHASLPGAPNFSPCQPAGWDVTDLEFSPAVCPSGWTAYGLGPTYQEGQTTTWVTSGNYVTIKTKVIFDYKTLSIAVCCSSGYTLSHAFDHPIFHYVLKYSACVQEISPGQAATTFRVHNPWWITWEASDVRHLTPSPPRLDCRYSGLSSWIPGATVDPSFRSMQDKCSINDGYQGLHFEPSSPNNLKTFITVGVPIIACLAMFVCIIGFCCYRSKRKYNKSQVMRARNQGDGADGGGGETASEENPPTYEMVTRSDPARDANPPPYRAEGGDR